MLYMYQDTFMFPLNISVHTYTIGRFPLMRVAESFRVQLGSRKAFAFPRPLPCYDFLGNNFWGKDSYPSTLSLLVAFYDMQRMRWFNSAPAPQGKMKLFNPSFKYYEDQ